MAASTISHCKRALYGVCAWRQWPLVPKYCVEQAAGRLLLDRLNAKTSSWVNHCIFHLRVACPPIFAPCYYGIGMSRTDEFDT